MPAFWAYEILLERSATLSAELSPFAVFSLAVRALHEALPSRAEFVSTVYD